MNKSCLLGAVCAGMLSLLFGGQALAAGPGSHLIITEVFADQPVDGQLTIKGEDLDFGNLLTVTLGDFGALTVVSETPMEIIVDMPAGLTPGDYLLTVSRGNGQSKNDEYDLTIAAEPEAPDPGGPLDCPDGYTEVNDNYCIETDQNPAGSTIWTTANSTCITANARLCSSGEWVHACQNSGSLGLINLPPSPRGLEWLGDLSDGAKANRLGQSISSASCTAGNGVGSITLDNSNFRCCFER
jgi:hypothetical protein